MHLALRRLAGRGEEDRNEETYLARAPGVVDQLFSGPREAMRPILEQIISQAEALGSEVSSAPCKTYVPIYRNHVFAQIKPTTPTRIDLGLALKGAVRQIPPRFTETGGLEKGDRITHRITIASADEVDAEVADWLGEAFRLDG